jgi:hypothetical protein
MRKLLYIISGLIVLGMVACQKDPSIEKTSTYPLSGEWWVTLRDADGNVVADYAKLLTYNTSSNKGDSLWIDDQGNIWTFKVKVGCNAGSKTFSVADSVTSVSEDYNIKIDVKDGKVVLKGGKTKNGNVSDSIYFKIGFGDDPGNTYVISGVRRTGFKDDDY